MTARQPEIPKTASWKFAWLDQVALDPEVSPAAFRLAYAISNRLFHPADQAFASQKWYAKVLGTGGDRDPTRQIRRALEILVVRGHLRTISGRGPNSGNKYEAIVTDRFKWPKRDETADTDVRSGEQNRTPTSDQTGHPRPALPDAHVRHKPSSETIDLSREERAATRPSAKGSRLPTSWCPPEDAYDFGASLGLTSVEVEAQAAQFADYWRAQPGARGVKADWTSTWRNWLRKHVQWKAERQEAGQRRGPANGTDWATRGCGS
jgi:hypothetical protein